MNPTKEITAFINRKMKAFEKKIKAEKSALVKVHISEIYAEYAEMKRFVTSLVEIKKTEEDFIDLGLPSGRLWAKENEPGYHQFDGAVRSFGDLLPSLEAWQELMNECKIGWDNKRNGFVVTGPNGNTLFFPSNGMQTYNDETKILVPGSEYGVGHFGNYWTSTEYDRKEAKCALFKPVFAALISYDKFGGFSVRLCRLP